MIKIEMDSLDRKLTDAFSGRVVKKDLVHKMKAGANVPIYVLEYLLGKYCSSTDPKVVEEGLEHVKQTLVDYYVRADESEKVKSHIREKGHLRIIDKVKVKLVETEDKYWAELVNTSLKYVNINEREVKKFEKLLMGGLWCVLDILYNPEIFHKGSMRPFVIEKIKPIQLATTGFKEYKEKRKLFARDEWLDILLRTIGLEPTHADFTPRKKMILISRLIPLVENNFNFVELGPRGTGKSFVYREISPYCILISGGKTTVPSLFVHLGTGRLGLVGLWDVVAFDEVAGLKSMDPDAVQILKDYMESGSFSRGKEEISANASLVFNGNINLDIETLVKTSHLFIPFPPNMQDMALIDRFHMYLSGWEVDKMKPEYIGEHYGFVVDFLAEMLRELRKTNFTDVVDKYFKFGNHLNQRDVKAARKIVSGMIKLLHPDGSLSKEELEEILIFALEMRRRVKEQLKKMGGMEYWATNFSYFDLDSGEERFVTVPETRGGGLIVEGVQRPGVIYTIGIDTADAKYCLFRIEIESMKGSGKKRVTGAPGKAMKDAIETAYDYVKANLGKLSVDKSLPDYDLHIQIVNLMQSKEGSQAGVAFFVSILSALLQKPIRERLVILGEMSIHGILMPVSGLTEMLQVAMDAGAKRVLIPVENKRELAEVPVEVLDKLEVAFYTDPINAGFKAMELE